MSGESDQLKENFNKALMKAINSGDETQAQQAGKSLEKDEKNAQEKELAKTNNEWKLVKDVQRKNN